MRPKICAVITEKDFRVIKELTKYKPYFVELRIDMIGDGWEKLVHRCKIPWIATNRSKQQGGRWKGSEKERIEQLYRAIDLDASMIDIEITTENLRKTVNFIKKRGVKCLISYHNFQNTPNLLTLKKIVKKQIDAGADIWKVVTTAREFNDNLIVLQLIQNSETLGVSFAMSELGLLSRLLCPLVGGFFTYAPVERGKESAPGQITIKELGRIYEIMGYKK